MQVVQGEKNSEVGDATPISCQPRPGGLSVCTFPGCLPALVPRSCVPMAPLFSRSFICFIRGYVFCIVFNTGVICCTCIFIFNFEIIRIKLKEAAQFLGPTGYVLWAQLPQVAAGHIKNVSSVAAVSESGEAEQLRHCQVLLNNSLLRC